MKRRTFLSIAAGAGALGVGGLALPQLASPSGDTRRYTFSDDFDGPAGSAPDPSKWAYDIGNQGWGGQQIETYTASRENSFLDGRGNLVIRATKVAKWTGVTHETVYYSARLKTLGRFSQYHGTFEARIKVDPQRGAWPAWWMMGANIDRIGWPACGEVDMLENYGDRTGQTSVHTPNRADNGVFTRFAPVAMDSRWHVWRVVWGPGDSGFSFYRDEARYLTVRPSALADWCFNAGVPMFMLLNLAVGGLAGTPPPNARFPIDLLIDYVRVW